MAGTSAQRRSFLGEVVHRFTDKVTSLPPCVICGRGHAQIGWLVDSFGRINGRCEGCADSDELRIHQAAPQ